MGTTSLIMTDSIFKSYDIRGVYPQQIHEEIGYLIGRSLVLYLTAKQVVIGRDCRLSSPALADAVIRGVRDQGADVIEIGLTSTPMFYFAVIHTHAPAGIMVTASHNPKAYNGFKLIREHAIPLSDQSGIRQIEQMIRMGLPHHPNKKGLLRSTSLLQQYTDFILLHTKISRKLKIVVDSGNGMAGLTFPEVYKNLPLQIIHLYKNLDGEFPNHEPDPLNSENLRAICAEVRLQKADLGLAFDADADRIIFIDEHGIPISSDYILILLAKQLHKNDPTARFIYDCRSTQVIAEEFGPLAIIHRVGHAFIKQSMRSQQIPLAGEISGHFYFKESFFVDDAVLAAVKILTILSAQDAPISTLIKPFQRYIRSGEINLKVENPAACVTYVHNYFKNEKIETIDGITVHGSDWWANVRASNTEPLLRICIEARTKKLLDEKLEVLKTIVTTN